MSTVVLHSGGVDSTVALYAARAEMDTHAVGFDYSQEHAEELEAAAALCADLGVLLDEEAGWVDMAAEQDEAERR